MRTSTSSVHTLSKGKEFRVSPIRLFLFLLTLALLISPLSLYAHAELVQATPAPGEELTTSPNEIRLQFNEAVTAESTISLFTANFQAIPGLTTHTNPADPTVVIALLPQLTPNQYTVQWTAVSADGHQITGSYSFNLVENNTPGPEILLVGFFLVLLVAIIARATRSLAPKLLP